MMPGLLFVKKETGKIGTFTRRSCPDVPEKNTAESPYRQCSFRNGCTNLDLTMLRTYYILHSSYMSI